VQYHFFAFFGCGVALESTKIAMDRLFHSTPLARAGTMWMRGKEAADWIGVSRDTIERRGVGWHPQAVPYRVRFRLLQLDPGAEPTRRYYRPDVESLLRDPPSRSRTPKMVPKFRMAADPGGADGATKLRRGS
jgi:hypothetical protein